jgi:hypothetical protein
MIIFTSDIGKEVVATRKLNTCCCKEQLTVFFIMCPVEINYMLYLLPYLLLGDIQPCAKHFAVQFFAVTLLILQVVQGCRHWQNINLILHKAPHGKVKRG